MDKYDVTYKGQKITRLNERLAAQQKVTDEQLAALRLSHVMRHVIFSEAKKTKDRRKLKLLAKLFEELEYLQQTEWNFPQDNSYHYWFDLPGCSCPKIDNLDARGVPNHRYVHTECLAHGDPPKRKRSR